MYEEYTLYIPDDWKTKPWYKQWNHKPVKIIRLRSYPSDYWLLIATPTSSDLFAAAPSWLKTSKLCSCDIMDLMNLGCQCGGR